MQQNVRKFGLVTSLVAAAERISHIGDLEDQFHSMLIDARQLAKAEAAAIWISNAQHLQCSAIHAASVAPACWSDLGGRCVQIDRTTPAGLAACQGSAVWLDAEGVPPQARFASPIGFDLLTGYATRNLLALPLFDETAKLTGVLELLNTQFHRSPSDQADHEGTLADQQASLGRICAVALRNAMLQSELRGMQQETVHRLSHAVEFCDEHMHDHIRRMSRTVGIVARTMGLSAQLVENIEYAAPMHDIGKLGVPESILRMPRRLSSQERRVMESHAHLGGELLDCSSNEILILARQMAISHHERWDGQGYPNRLCGDQIPLTGRICALADVFDALVSRRSYKRPYPIPAAVGMIQSERARHFDPEIVDAFIAALREIMDLYDHPVRQGIEVA
ncbi:MAG: HD-GYP domain-containing protein [Phycisphaerae bacterium]